MLDVLPITKSLWRSKTAAILIIAQLAITIAIVSNALYFVSQRQEKIDRPTGIALNELFKIASVKANSDVNLEVLAKADMDMIRAMPGVIDASLIDRIPLTGGGSRNGFALTQGESDAPNIPGNIFSMGEEGLNTLGMNLIEGRNFTTDEVKYIHDPNALPERLSVIVSKKFANEAYPDESSLGKTMYVGSFIPVTIIGVVEQMMGSWPNRADSGSVVFSPEVAVSTSTNYLIRTAPEDRAETMLAVMATLREKENARILNSEESLESILNNTYSQDYAMIKVLFLVISMLVLVNALGIIGLTTFWVNQRRKQIGIRRALGATKMAIIRYFIVENILICTCAVIIGWVLAIGASDYMVRHFSQNLLPWQYVVLTALIILLLTVLSAMTPAMRASQISPAEATA